MDRVQYCPRNIKKCFEETGAGQTLGLGQHWRGCHHKWALSLALKGDRGSTGQTCLGREFKGGIMVSECSCLCGVCMNDCVLLCGVYVRVHMCTCVCVCVTEIWK